MPHRTRNVALRHVRKDADFVLFCDDDMAPYKDSLVQMVKLDQAVVSALCTTRTIPVRLAIRYWPEDRDEIVDVPPKSIEHGKVYAGRFLVGAAFLLLRRDALENVTEYVLSGRDWLDENRALFNRLHVRAENREKERVRIESARRAFASAVGYANIFEFSLQGEVQQRGEDYHLCRSLIRLGYSVHVDTTLQVAHVGDYPYGPWLHGIEHVRESLLDGMTA